MMSVITCPKLPPGVFSPEENLFKIMNYCGEQIKNFVRGGSVIYSLSQATDIQCYFTSEWDVPNFVNNTAISTDAVSVATFLYPTSAMRQV